MSSVLRRHLQGLGCVGAIALLLVVIGVLALLLELQSPTSVLWTGTAVVGHDTGGVVLYPLNGHNETVIVANEAPSTPPHPVTVYVDPTNPGSARVDSAVTRWFDAGFVAARFVAAMVFVGLGLVRRSRRRRAALRRGHSGGFGHGFHPDQLGGGWPERRPPEGPA